MALTITIKETKFGVGDRIRVVQRITDGDKERESIFEGMVISIKGRDAGKSFMVRRVGEAGVGIERIFPAALPSIEKISVVKEGTRGVRRAKLYYTREKSPTEIEAIYKKAQTKGSPPKKSVKKSSPKKAKPAKKTSSKKSSK